MLTISDVLQLTRIRSPERNERAGLLGLGLFLLCDHPALVSRKLGWHCAMLNRAIELSQIKAYFDKFGRFCGYAWWVQIPPELESRILKFGMEALEADQLCSEGDVWMLDFRSNLGESPSIFADLRQGLLTRCKTITYFRYKRGVRIAKRITREGGDLSCCSTTGDLASDETAWLRSDQGRSSLLTAGSVLEKWIKLGEVLELLAQVEHYAQMSLSDVLGRIRHALEFRQSKLLRDADGGLLAFFSWAWREAGELVDGKPLHEWGPGEWRDGRDTILCDAVAIADGTATLRRELSTFTHYGKGFYIEALHYNRRQPILPCAWLTLPVSGTGAEDFVALIGELQANEICPL